MRQLEESPTRASTRATTRIAMLNKISDRVQQSQEEFQTLHTGATTQQNPSAARYPQNVQGSEGVAAERSSSVHNIGGPSDSRRYDIETLIEIGSKVHDFSQVLLKIKPEAIAENLFQYMGIDKSLRPPARSRGLSDVTNLSRRSMMSSTGMNEWEPARQPRAAPRASDSKNTSFLQQHEGFIRFLKQHASPPHHRVTAGGRIVPTGPLSPPPMFDYASLNGLLEGQPVRAQFPVGSRTTLQGHPDSEVGLASSDIKTRATNPGFHGNQAAVTQPANLGLPYSSQPFMGSLSQSLPSSLALTPLGVFPDGTALISCNGICYRCFWNGMTTVMEPLTTGQPLLVPNEAPLNDNPLPFDKSFYTSGTYGNVVPSSLSHPVEVPFKGTPAMSNTNTSQTLDATATANSSHSEEGSLKAQLTSLDKYMALHHFEIGPSVKIQLVSRRKTLVEAIAKFRSDREPSIQTIPIVSTSMDTSRKSSAQSVTNRIVIETQRQGLDRSLNKNANEKVSVKKCLSPSAPAFVPKNVAKSCTAGSLTLPPVPGNGSTSTMSNPSAAIKSSGNSLAGFSKQDPRMREVSSSSEGKSYIEVDPWDPAMKIVPPSMIEYARKYEPNNASIGKKFCTTTEEFQEAIRRVREQARMWGCVGGNSKDPAYDAEEDIWYAIKDEYPIPLPTSTPDHITCPRPWNWYDSAFNVNATVEPKMNMRGHNGDEITAHSSKDVSVRNSSMNMFAAKITQNEAAKDKSDGQLSKNSLHHSMRDGRQVTAQGGSYKLLDRYENEQRWKLFKEQNFETSDAFRKESSRANYKHKEFQNKHNLSLSQVKEMANIRLSDTSKAQDQVAQTHNSNAKAIWPPSHLGLSAAQALYNPIDFKSTHQPDMDSCPQTPSSSPNKAKSGTFYKGMIAPMNTTPPSEAAKIKQNISNGNSQLQNIISGPVSPSDNGGLRNRSYNLADLKTLGLNTLVSSESKGAWGPDQSCSAPESGDAPKVNIPNSYTSGQIHLPYDGQNLQRSHSTIQAPTDHEANLEHAVGTAGVQPKTFLKDMLKDPRYSLDYQHNYIDPMKSRTSMMDPAIAQHMVPTKRDNQYTKELGTREQQDQRMTDKENEKHRAPHGDANAVPRIDNRVTNAPNAKLGQFSTPQMPASPTTSKAISLMAATTYHTQGFLPSYDEAGKAQAASIYRHQSHRVSQNRPRVNPSLSSSHNHSYYSSDQSRQRTPHDHCSHGTKSRYIPVILGYDGSEEPAVDDKTGSKKDRPEERADEYTDRNEVTTADFDHHRPDHDNEWHRGAVNDFFRDLHEKEVKWMMARQRRNTKTAP